MPVWSHPETATDEDLSVVAAQFKRLGLPEPGSGFSGEVPRETALGGSAAAEIGRLWKDYRAASGDGEFIDSPSYSADGTYRWSYERRWAPGASLCWIGLNPGTGDTDNKPRPTLAKVVTWAKREGCSAVVVVNLFSYRSTDPKELRKSAVDIVGDQTDHEIRSAATNAKITLVAWGGDKVIRGRSAEVLKLLEAPMCVGVTKGGEPRHPLFIPSDTAFVPYPVA